MQNKYSVEELNDMAKRVVAECRLNTMKAMLLITLLAQRMNMPSHRVREMIYSMAGEKL